MSLQADIFSLLLLAVGFISFFIFRSKLLKNIPESRLNFSSLFFFKKISWRQHWLPTLYWSLILALGCLSLAFLDLYFSGIPKESEQKTIRKEMPQEGIAIYLLLDESGSMKEVIQSEGPDGQQANLPKIDFLKMWTKQFILSRPSDLIGIIAFARIPRVLVPLTLDQDELLKKLSQVHVVENPNDDGTAMGYAIFKSVNLIAATRHLSEELPPGEKPPYSIKNSIIVVVTDGFQDPSRLDYGNRLRTIDLPEAAENAKKQGIRLYVINVDPAMATDPEYAPHRRQMKQITQLTGGDFFSVGKTTNLKQAFQEINRIEKGAINLDEVGKPQPKEKVRLFSFYPYLIAIGMILIFLFILLETLIFRPNP